MTIKLEVGKKYRNRKREVVEIEKNFNSVFYRYVGSDNRFYSAHGSVFENKVHECDLIEEVIEARAKKPHNHVELIKAWADGIPMQKRYPLAVNVAQHRAECRCFLDVELPLWLY